MLKVSLQTLRARWVSFLGTFIALVIGVALMSAMSAVLLGAQSPDQQPPKRFSDAPVVVRAAEPSWATELNESDKPQLSLNQNTADLLVKNENAVIDRTFYAQLVNGPVSQVGHPWSIAQATPYSLVLGKAPTQNNEIVVPQNSAQLGQLVKVFTVKGPNQYLVVGNFKATDFEHAIFFSDAEAARLSPNIDVVAVFGSVESVQKLVGSNAQILTGQERSQLDPDKHATQQALNSTSIIASMATGLVAFVAIFIVASTFAFAVSQRLRELALFGLIGATPKQVRNMILAEALIISMPASILGCAIGWVCSPTLADLFIKLNLAPVGFAASTSLSPVLAALLLGILVALVGAFAAAKRATRVRAIEALRESSLEHTSITKGRMFFGIATMCLAIAAMIFVALKTPHIATLPFIYIWVLLLPILAFALLSPMLIGSFTKIICAPFRPKSNATAMLVSANILGSKRRTASIVAPILLTVGLCLTLTSAVNTIQQASITEAANQLTAGYILKPQNSPGLNPQLINDLRATGATVATQTRVIFYATDDDADLRRYSALAIDPSDFEDTHNIQLVSGSFSDLNESSIIVSESLGLKVGDSSKIELFNGSEQTLKVVAVVKNSIAGTDAYILSSYAAGQLAQQAAVNTTNINELQNIANQNNAQFVSTAYQTTIGASQATQVGLFIVMGLTIIYSALAIVNTVIMSSAARLTEFSKLRMAGATNKQVLQIAAYESIVAVVIGVFLSVIAFVINCVGLQFALSQMVSDNHLIISWVPSIIVVTVAFVLTIGACIVPIHFGLRSHKFLALYKRGE